MCSHIPRGQQEEPQHGWLKASWSTPGTNPMCPSPSTAPPAQFPPRVTAWEVCWGCWRAAGEAQSGWTSAESLPGVAGAPSCACPKDAAESSQGHGTVGSTHGRDIWGQQNLEEGSRRRAGCVSAGEGDSLCPGQLFPSFLPLPGQWVKAAAEEVGEEQLCVPVLCLGTISTGQSCSQAFGESWFWSSIALSAAVLAQLCLTTLSLLLLSPLKREKAQLCCVSWKFRLQLCKCPEVLHPPGTPAFTLNANCSLNVSVGGF